MKRLICITLTVSLFFLWRATDTCAQEILVVRNLGIKPYSEALSGFKAVLGGKYGTLSYTVKDSEGAVVYLRRKKPDLILAIGIDALQAVKRYSTLPIVYCMVLVPPSQAHSEKNITGVGMTVSPEVQLSVLRQVLPGVRRIGLMYDPGKSASFVQRAHGAARAARIELLEKEISHPRSVLEALNSLKGAIDAIWMIPDTTVVTPETAEMIMLFSLENRLPVSTFSAKYLEMGALLSLDISATAMGRQAGELAAGILSGAHSWNAEAIDADSPTLIINETVARKLRIPLGDEIRSKARILK